MDKRRGACITIFCQSFCLTNPKTFVGQPFCVSEKNQVSKKFTNKKEISFFCANSFLSHRVQKFRRGTRLCFRNLRVSKNFMDKRRGGCITILCQSFYLTVPKTFAREPLCFSEKNRLSKNSTHKKRILSFCARNFLSRRAQSFRGGTRLCFRKIRVSKIFWMRDEGGVSRLFVKVFVSQYWKIS